MRAIVAGEDMTLTFYEGPPFKLKQTHKAHDNYIQAVSFNWDAKEFVSVSNDRKIQFYDGKTGEILVS